MSLPLYQKLRLMVPVPFLFASEEQKAAVKLRRILSQQSAPQATIRTFIDEYTQKKGAAVDTVKRLIIIGAKLGLKHTATFHDVLQRKSSTAADYAKGLSLARDHYKDKQEARAFFGATAALAGAGSIPAGIFFPFTFLATLPLAMGGIFAYLRTSKDRLAGFDKQAQKSHAPTQGRQPAGSGTGQTTVARENASREPSSVANAVLAASVNVPAPPENIKPILSQAPTKLNSTTRPAQALSTASKKLHIKPEAHASKTASTELDLKPETLAKLREVLPIWRSQGRKACKEQIKILSGQGSSLIFYLWADPSVIFKIAWYQSDATINRFKNMEKARAVIDVNRLDRLRVPKARLLAETFGGEQIQIIAEEKVDIAPSMLTDEELYRKHDAHLGPVFTQLATFITLTGFDDVEFRNIPLIQSREDPTHFAVALVDLEHMKDTWLSGITGGMYRGLIRCSTPRHFPAIREAAAKAGVTLPADTRAEVERINELQMDAKILAFHTSKGLVNDSARPLPKLTLQDLDLKDEVRPNGVKLSEVLAALIDTINEEIAHRSKKLPADLIKQRRDILVNVNEALRPYDQLPFERLSPGQRNALSDAEYAHGKWLAKCIHALVEKKHIFSLKGQNGHGYFIQA